MQQKRQQSSFQNIVQIVAKSNAHRLMERARTANRIAKCTKGKNKQIAYRVKTEALVTLSTSFTEQTFITDDPRTPKFVLVQILAAGFGLHAPADKFIRSQSICIEE